MQANEFKGKRAAFSFWSPSGPAFYTVLRATIENVHGKMKYFPFAISHFQFAIKDN
jgi:hypothetical protein